MVVALRKESVDRNSVREVFANFEGLSLSARRAWIEMYYGDDLTYSDGSLSARRAWIEIDVIRPAIDVFLGRSPQGERG